MIEVRLFNLRAYELACLYAKKNHTKVFYIYKQDTNYYAVPVETKVILEQIPQYYTEYMFFWFRKAETLIKRYKNKITFVDIAHFMEIINDLT